MRVLLAPGSGTLPGTRMAVKMRVGLCQISGSRAPHKRGFIVVRKRFTPEQFINHLREAEILVNHGKTAAESADEPKH